MKRISHRRSGYDCLHAPCQHTPKGDHGISGGAYHWAVVDGDVALSAMVHTQEFPETVPKAKRDEMARREAEDIRRGLGPTGSIGYHSAFPPTREDVLNGPTKEPCDLLDVPCYNAGDSYLAIREELRPVMAFDANGLPTFEQPEAFWLALEAKLRRRAATLRAERADLKWKVCPTCGQGTVEVA